MIIHPKCPQKFTQKDVQEIHPKRGILADKNVHENCMRNHQNCPQEFAFYLPENSATLDVGHMGSIP